MLQQRTKDLDALKANFQTIGKKLQQLPSNLPHQDELTRRATTEGGPPHQRPLFKAVIAIENARLLNE